MAPLPAIAWAVVAVTCVIHFVLIEVFKLMTRQLMSKGVMVSRQGTNFFERV